MNLDEIFAQKLTENGDTCFNSTTDKLIDILFMSEYYQKHLDEVSLEPSELNRLFAMFIRDPRFGVGRRDLGRKLMDMTNCDAKQIVKAGRYDDLFSDVDNMSELEFKALCKFLKNRIEEGDELCKKWMPRYSSKNLMLARRIAKEFGMNKQQYGHFIKCNTTENKLSRKNTDEILFEQVPSLAMLKYYKRFCNGTDTCDRFKQYLEDVKQGKKKLNVSTTNVYDIYKNRATIDVDLFFDKIEKVSGSWIPVVDTSGSMCDANDSFGKAIAIGHYLAKCSTYAPDTVLSFSSKPQLIKLGEKTVKYGSYMWGCNPLYEENTNSKYIKEIVSMYTGDCSNTDFGAVCKKLSLLDPANAPDWIIVLSDMEFDAGSGTAKDKMMQIFKDSGMSNTKLLWWNFNSRNTTCPETDNYGNVFMSGYNPMLLKYLQVGFDSHKFLDALLKEYEENIRQ